MKISKVKLKNIRCFKDIELSFCEENGSPKSWTLLVGNNGQGKTTLLRSIALGLASEGEASGLLAELHNGIIRENEKKALIEITLKNDEKTYVLKNEITQNGNNEEIKQTISRGSEIERSEFDKNNLFVAAYGSGRSITGTEPYLEYAIVDSIYGLFNSSYKLQEAELGLRRLSENKDQQTKLFKLLRKVLLLRQEDEISLERNGLYIKSIWGKMPFQTLSDGYKSMTTVIVDFLSWWQLQSEKSFSDANSISGIFIVDELEQHLHPKWQRDIVEILSKSFPKVQFIGSTHAPVCALGCGNVDESQLVKVEYANGYSEVTPYDMKGGFGSYRADQLLTSEIFGLESSRGKKIQGKLNEYAKLYLKEELDENEKENKKNLEKELKDLPLWDNEQAKLLLERLNKDSI